jgi:hypothetical protein
MGVMRLILIVALSVAWVGCTQEQPKATEQVAKALTDEAGPRAIDEAGKAVKQAHAAVDDAIGEEMKDAMKTSCAQGGCTQVCKAGKPCEATCAGGRCTQTCEKDANCELTCSGGNCKQHSEQASTAKLTCSGGNCEQTCKGACKKTCSGKGCS